VEKGEKFCEKCGAKIPTRADRIRAVHRSKERQENL
jgi:ribosomal protein L40E